MGILLDLIIVAILLISVIISAKRGFVKVLVETVGFVAAVVLAFAVSTPLAELTFNKVIEPPLIAAAVESGTESSEKISGNVINAIPDFFPKKIENYAEKMTEYVAANIEKGAETAVKTASQTVLKPTITRILSLLYSIILIVVLSIAVKFIAKFLNKIFSFSIIGKANKLLGGAAGLVKGILICVLFSAVVSLIVSLSGGGFLIFTKENIDSSHLFSLFVNFDSFKI